MATVMGPAIAQTAQQRAVRVTATVSVSPPSITLAWPADATATGYTVAKRILGAPTWGTAQTVPGGAAATGYSDSLVVPGTRYEYRVDKNGSPFGIGIVASGIESPAIHDRGKLLLVVDATKAAGLGSRLDRLIRDLTGDGWRVVRIDVLPTQTAASVKALLAAERAADPANVRAVFLLGRVPVPYSGQIAPDGHVPDDLGAWAADVYYGEFDGPWTDTSVNVTGASRIENRNIPGDGKFDQSAVPSDVDLWVGRVDFANMTTFAASELTLLQNYLDKNHDYRHKVIAPAEQAVIDDNFGYFGGEAFSASGWRNFSSLLGPANVTAADYFTTLNTPLGPGYQWSYGCGGGSYQSAGGIGTTTDFTTSANRNIFTILFGSYFGDWDSANNFLRAPLCSGWTLTSCWAGRPHWSFHMMGMGDPIGAAARYSQNDTTVGGVGTRGIHIALMGDPTLRQHVLAPPTSLTATAVGPLASLSWTASTDSVDGYHVYRAISAAGPFVRLTTAPEVGTTYLDATTPTLTAHYMVRATKLHTSASGTYWNLSQGDLATACANSAPIVQMVGAGCGTLSPSLAANAPTIGQMFTMTLSGAEPGAMAQIYGGTLGTPTDLGGGCLVQLALPSLVLFSAPTLDANGGWSFSMNLPNDPAALCLGLDFQAIVLETGGFALSNALRLVIGQ